jgi:uncharacterized RDD family membrane protein YckC
MAWFQRPQPKLGTEGDVVWRRVVAVLIDLVLIGVLTAALGAVARVGGAVGVLLSFAYYIYLEGTYGQTIGKMALGIVVVTDDGGSIDYRPAAIRSVFRLVDVLPAFYLLGFAVVFLTDRSKRLGDIVADTVVVRAR